ncbi:MAG: 3-oxoacyl-[acyl-carrier-protein] synthase 2 [Nevskia sp.]|nr:3-oxoacyl-[acyl-carrier-protein] synthase 2 [Nevskia sp.]
MPRHRVVVTGFGLVTPFGVGQQVFWEGLTQGRSAITAIDLFDASAFRTRIAGACPSFAIEHCDYADADRTDRVSQFALAAASEAMRSSGLEIEDEEATGVILGTGIGGITTIDAAQKSLHTKGPRFVSPMTVPMSMFNAAASHICIRYGLRGPCFTLSTACSSGSNAIGEAFRTIQHGYATSMLAGGADAPLSYGIFSGWNALRVMSQRNDTPATAMRPFSRDRDGLVLSEGAAIVVLEEYEHARRRGAAIHAELIGYGYNNDGLHATRPSVDGQTKSIRRALADAELDISAVDYINAHGTATSANDATETQAVKNVFGAHAKRLPMSSIKSMIGHSMGAAGAIEFVASVLSLREGVLPPTINYHVPDPDCDLDYVANVAREARISTVLSNSFAFGGCNAILALRALH